MGHPVPMRGDEIALALEAKSRQPFREILARILDAEPTPEAMREFAKKSPDRWAQAIAIFGRLGGFNDKLEVESTVLLDVSRMSDAELQVRLEKLREPIEAAPSDQSK